MTSGNPRSPDPFGDNAERIHSPTSSQGTQPPVSPISETSDAGTAVSIDSVPEGTLGVATAATAATAAIATVSVTSAAGAATTGLARKTSIRRDVPKPLDLTLPPPVSAVPPSPAGTEFSMNSIATGQAPGPSTSAAAIAAAGGPPTSTVHRVQLDFKPTLEDEMELRGGQLVRLLHEYDDGWVSTICADLG